MFPPTRWSLVLAAHGAESEPASQALDELCRTYRPALVAFATRALGSPQEAEDATHDFFADFLARRRLDAADPSLGRFRTFVLTHFQLVLSDRLKRRRAAKRGGGQVDLPWEVIPEGDQPAILSDSAWLDAEWAAGVVREALRRLEAEQEGVPGAIPHAVMRRFLPGFQTEASPGYEELAREHGVSPGALRVRVSRLRQRFGEHVNAVLADTVSEASDVDQEREALVAAAASAAFGQSLQDMSRRVRPGR